MTNYDAASFAEMTPVLTFHKIVEFKDSIIKKLENKAISGKVLETRKGFKLRESAAKMPFPAGP
jgi:hypothetical protein